MAWLSFILHGPDPTSEPFPVTRVPTRCRASGPVFVLGSVPSDLTVISALDVSSMEAAMSHVSTVPSHAPRQRQATVFDACLAAAMRGIMLVIAAIANELRIRRDMRQLAAMDDHMLKDIGLCRCEIESCVRYGRD